MPGKGFNSIGLRKDFDALLSKESRNSGIPKSTLMGWGVMMLLVDRHPEWFVDVDVNDRLAVEKFITEKGV